MNVSFAVPPDGEVGAPPHPAMAALSESAESAERSARIEARSCKPDATIVKPSHRQRAADATHQGDFMGLPATGKSYTISETHIFHMRDVKVAEHWRDADMLGLMRQLGALPEPPKK